MATEKDSRRYSSSMASVASDKQKPQKTVGRRTHIIFNEVTRIEGTKNPSTKRHRVRCNHCGAELEGRRETLVTHFQRVCPDMTEETKQRIFSNFPLDKALVDGASVGGMNHASVRVEKERIPSSSSSSLHPYQVVHPRHSNSPVYPSQCTPPNHPIYHRYESVHRPSEENSYKGNNFTVGYLMADSPRHGIDPIQNHRKRSHPYSEPPPPHYSGRSHRPPPIYPAYRSVSTGYVTAPSSTPTSPRQLQSPGSDIWADRLNVLEDFVDRRYISSDDADSLRPLIFNKDDRVNIIYLGYEKQPMENRHSHRLTRGLLSLLDEIKPKERPLVASPPISLLDAGPVVESTPSPHASES